MGGNEMSESITEDLLCLPAGESMDKTPEIKGRSVLKEDKRTTGGNEISKSKTSRTDAIWRLIKSAVCLTLNSEQQHACGEAAKNGIEDLETELNALKSENERLKADRQRDRFQIDQLTLQNERLTREQDDLRKKIESGVSAYEASLVEATQLRAMLAEMEKDKERLDIVEGCLLSLVSDAASCSLDMAGNRVTLQIRSDGKLRRIRAKTIRQAIDDAKGTL
jgi:FtsZ-binding cell division protein ZapB